MSRVYLDTIEDRVSYATWAQIYERARHVAKQWKPRPLALGWRQVGDVRVAQYVLDIETEYGLYLIGDAETRTTGESFVFLPRVGCAASRCVTGGSLGTADDVLVAVTHKHELKAEQISRLRDLFGENLGAAIEVAQLDELRSCSERPVSTRWCRRWSAKQFGPCSRTTRYDNSYADDD